MALSSQDQDVGKSRACASSCLHVSFPSSSSSSHLDADLDLDDISASSNPSFSCFQSCCCHFRPRFPLSQSPATKIAVQDQHYRPSSSPCPYPPSSHHFHYCCAGPPVRRKPGQGAHGPESSPAPDIFNIPALLYRKWPLLALAIATNTYILLHYSSHFSTSSREEDQTNCSASLLNSLYLIIVNMVANVGGLAARAVFLMSTRPIAQRADVASYTNNAVAAIRTLESTWYDVGSGLWDNAWWNSANAFTTLADFANLNRDAANELNIGGILMNTFQQAQKATASASKSINAAGLVTTSYAITKREVPLPIEGRQMSAQGFPNFINEFYDDEGWWALGLIRAYDVTQNQDYLDMAVRIFADMKTGGNTNCNGGIYWSKDRKYVNAIANELYLSVAASLANRISGDKASYLKIATDQWTWFKATGMINAQGTINDGLDGNCKNNGANVWSYNQGVVLGGLVELSKANGDKSVLTDATNIAKAAIKQLADDNGILHDTCEPNCGSDGNQFKGIFVRNLRYLQEAAPNNDFKTFITKNADSNWNANRDSAGKMGVVWSGPAQGVSGPTHSSALDSIVAAVAVA
ncbi:glycosyl hydrolase [Colletotrichum abscissum]|uniref:Glycosyl hydrolase n=1 Tax=Colletotrichum abscissum TaxID=1671311 RepID=A0A9P9X7W5_9PEZI|nr:glycosyl hydrolase [Colletotrichum abscissum]